MNIDAKLAAWHRINGILRESALDSVEALQLCGDGALIHAVLQRCMAQAAHYACGEIDDSLFPPAIRFQHQAMIDSIPRALKTRDQLIKDKESGQMALF